MHRLLIVEDQKNLLASLRRGLEEEGYGVSTASTGEEAYFLATTETFGAVVLDLMLPGRTSDATTHEKIVNLACLTNDSRSIKDRSCQA